MSSPVHLHTPLHSASMNTLEMMRAGSPRRRSHHRRAQLHSLHKLAADHTRCDCTLHGNASSLHPPARIDDNGAAPCPQNRICRNTDGVAASSPRTHRKLDGDAASLAPALNSRLDDSDETVAPHHPDSDADAETHARAYASRAPPPPSGGSRHASRDGAGTCRMHSQWPGGLSNRERLHQDSRGSSSRPASVQLYACDLQTS